MTIDEWMRPFIEAACPGCGYIAPQLPRCEICEAAVVESKPLQSELQLRSKKHES